jgi:hypothetical protein
MRGVQWLALSVLATALAFSNLASGDPKPDSAAAEKARAAGMPLTLRFLEGAPGEVQASAERFDVTRRLGWRTGPEETMFVGIPESLLKLKLRAEGARASVDLMGTLVRATEEDAQLGRPPMIAVTIQSLTFRGVVESLATNCDAKQCEADVVVLLAPRAVTRSSATRDDPARSPGF